MGGVGGEDGEEGRGEHENEEGKEGENGAFGVAVYDNAEKGGDDGGGNVDCTDVLAGRDGGETESDMEVVVGVGSEREESPVYGHADSHEDPK